MAIIIVILFKVLCPLWFGPYWLFEFIN